MQLIGAATAVGIHIFWLNNILSKEIGVYYAFSAINEVLLAATTLSIDQAIISNGEKPGLKNSGMTILIITSLLYFIFGIIAINSMSIFSDNISGNSYVGILLLISGILTNAANYAALSRFASERIDEIVFRRTVAYLFGCFVSILLSYKVNSALSMVTRDFVFSISALYLLDGARNLKIRPTWNKDNIQIILSFCIKNWFINLIARLSLRLDYFFISRNSSIEVFGAYAQLRSIIEGVVAPLNYQIQTFLFSYLAREQRSQIRKISFPATGYILTILCAVATVTCLISAMMVGNGMLVSFWSGWQVRSGLLPGILLGAIGVIFLEFQLAFLKSVSRHHYLIIPHFLRMLVLLPIIFIMPLPSDTVSWIVGGMTIVAAALGIFLTQAMMAGRGTVQSDEPLQMSATHGNQNAPER